jgi:putative FmdB family regulatory protein
MPTYEYQCDACQHNFDEFQSINDEPLKKCPKCKKKKLRRVFGTGAALIFRGSGFYTTDYRSESYKSAAKADQAKAETSSNGKGEGGAKDAAKPATTDKATK